MTPDERARRSVFVSMVIPAYNEEGSIQAVVREAIEVLGGTVSRFEVLVGNDGSTDGTQEVADALAAAYPQLRVIHVYPNRGVAQMCLDLYRRTQGDIVALFPGDGQVRPIEFLRLLEGQSRFDVVIGRRRPRRDPFQRRVKAWAWNMASRTLFGLRAWDVDSVKLFPGDLVRSVPVTSRTPFMETEILIRARARGLRIGNVDVEHFPRSAGRPSGGRAGVAITSLREMLWFWYRWIVRRAE